jgi:hypothetical protein
MKPHFAELATVFRETESDDSRGPLFTTVALAIEEEMKIVSITKEDVVGCFGWHFSDRHVAFYRVSKLRSDACGAKIVVTGTVEVLELASYLKEDLEKWTELTRIHRYNVGPLETVMSSGDCSSNWRFQRPRGGKKVVESEDEQAKVIVNWRSESRNTVGVQTPSGKGTAK